MPQTRDTGSTPEQVEPYLMSVLSSRLYSIGVEMTNTMVRSARSLLMSLCRDLSTAICDRNGDVISLPPSIPVHCANMGLTVKPAFDHPDGIHEGDLFLNNSPYRGNTHHADYTYIAPVFHDGELMFFTAAKGHQADCGNAIPSTYTPTARDLYEEGALDWPCVKIQKGYEDVTDLINIAKMRLRVPDQWYGDYLAGVGSARTGERRLQEMCAAYGNELILAFCEAYQEYGSRRIVEEIRQWPAGTWSYQVKHDPIPEVLPGGVDVHISANVDPDAGLITVDMRDNADCQDCGLNMSEATVTGSVRAGVLNRMAPDLPHNEGAMKHIRVLQRDNCIVGRPVLPHSASMATSNLADRVISGVQCLLNQITDARGMAEGGAVQSPALSVISGRDSRRGGEPYINQLFNGQTGGPGVRGHDGWVTYQLPNTGGALYWASVEVVEQRYPIRVVMTELISDSGGAGQWDAVPACKFVFTPRQLPVMAAYSCDGIENVPKGACGGSPGRAAAVWKYSLDEGEVSRVDLPAFDNPVLAFGEALVSECSSAGGYGDPLERDPDLVRHRAREGWISSKRARDVYGVVLDLTPELYAVDEEATESLRAEKRSARAASARVNKNDAGVNLNG
jgi:N-methylhydantoinase B